MTTAIRGRARDLDRAGRPGRAHHRRGARRDTDTATRRLGDHDFGPEAVAIDLQRDYLRWLDRWLKGIDNGIEREPPVSIYAMGSIAATR